MNITRIHQLLNQNQLDAWLIYQYQSTYEVGLNTLANDICGIKELVTRPWFCLITAKSMSPTWIYQSMEHDKFTHLSGKKLVYSSRDSLKNILRGSLPKSGKIAMEISSEANIPALSRVDYGTVSLLKKLTKAKIVSSQDLVGGYLSVWRKKGLLSHQVTVTKLIKILNLTKTKVKNEIGKLTDYDLQQYIEKLYARYDLETLYHPVVASDVNTGNPHYFPSPSKPVPILKNELLLIDIWGKTKTPGSVYADITTMFFTGHMVPDQIQKAWLVLTKARDRVLNYLTQKIKSADIKGSHLDQIGRKILDQSGYSQYCVHRIGHNIAAELHGFGPNLDNYETIDNRELLLDSGYSIEPGIYTSKFGLRSEINVYISPKRKILVSTPVPAEIQKII